MNSSISIYGYIYICVSYRAGDVVSSVSQRTFVDSVPFVDSDVLQERDDPAANYRLRFVHMMDGRFPLV